MRTSPASTARALAWTKREAPGHSSLREQQLRTATHPFQAVATVCSFGKVAALALSAITRCLLASHVLVACVAMPYAPASRGPPSPALVPGATAAYDTAYDPAAT